MAISAGSTYFMLRPSHSLAMRAVILSKATFSSWPSIGGGEKDRLRLEHPPGVKWVSLGADLPLFLTYMVQLRVTGERYTKD